MAKSASLDSKKKFYVHLAKKNNFESRHLTKKNFEWRHINF
jgi:hypothetical protein